MKVEVRPVENNEVSRLVVSPENEEEKQQLNSIFVFASLCPCKKVGDELVFAFTPSEKMLIKNEDGQLVDFYEEVKKIFGGV